MCDSYIRVARLEGLLRIRSLEEHARRSMLTTGPGLPTLLWFIELDHDSGMRHGGNLRWFNLSRELVARGCSVYFAINRTPEGDLANRVRYLDQLESDAYISGHVLVDYHYPRRQARPGRLLGSHPALMNHLLRAPQRTAAELVGHLLLQKRIDAVFISDRTFLFLIDTLKVQVPILVDWVDSFVLYSGRQALLHLRRYEPRATLAELRNVVEHYFQERYYGARAAANLLASPVDKRCLDAITHAPGKNHVLLNGVSITPPASVSGKLPSRLIFTGNMNFPPNYEAAIWFIDEVLPLILRQRPDVTFTVAGRRPVDALLSRASQSVQVIGDVVDIPTEIVKSSLYVAPLISGGGFKNKIVEAISCGVFVVSTPRGVEFLDPESQDLLLVGTSPSAFAEEVLRFLRDPELFNARLAILSKRVMEEYTWRHRAEELLAFLLPPGGRG